jgi:hypothetical protein
MGKAEVDKKITVIVHCMILMAVVLRRREQFFKQALNTYSVGSGRPHLFPICGPQMMNKDQNNENQHNILFTLVKLIN